MNLLQKITAIGLLQFLCMPVSVCATDTGQVIELSDRTGKLSCKIDCSEGCSFQNLSVNGRDVLSQQGIYTFIMTSEGNFSSRKSNKTPDVKKRGKSYLIDNIQYGDGNLMVDEVWTLTPNDSTIVWRIERTYSNDAVLEDMGFPMWNFARMDTWKGGILDNGGMVWCKYLDGENTTYAVHTPGVTYWEPILGDALSISVDRDGDAVYTGAAYSQEPQGVFSCRQYVADVPLKQRYHLSRFVRGHKDVFAPFEVKKGTETVTVTIAYKNYNDVYSRGDLKEIDANTVRELLNTTARYGVVDNGIVGGNGWTTNWKCMHEPFFGRIAWAVNDTNYTANLAYSLDQERDYALLPDGRMLSRWHDVQGDEIPGTYDKETGYYEAMWGYTIDSQPGYVLNVSDLFALTGDVEWVRSHKENCEKVLEWLIRRDSNGNGIFEMKNGHIREAKASDWTDIVWASFENAFVNVQMYAALVAWADIEESVLGDLEHAGRYRAIADRLKQAYNKPVSEGGFWHPEKHQYVYWRDNDGVIHGDNLFTPVNFAAIAYGICDDGQRISQLLDQIEKRMNQEQLFHWPLCFDSFRREEVSAGNWPFPNYENGDIFPTWGYLGVGAYAKYKPELAVKYIQLLLKQYQKDGLSSQRYSRINQQGVGSDILSGICTSITALYSDVYGVRPHWNYLELNPRMTPELDGTTFRYPLRGVDYLLQLSSDGYSVSFNHCKVDSKVAVGVASSDKGLLLYWKGDISPIRLEQKGKRMISVSVDKNTETTCEFALSQKGKYKLSLDEDYMVTMNGKPLTLAGENGRYTCSINSKGNTVVSIKKVK